MKLAQTNKYWKSLIHPLVDESKKAIDCKWVIYGIYMKDKLHWLFLCVCYVKGVRLAKWMYARYYIDLRDGGDYVFRLTIGKGVWDLTYVPIAAWLCSLDPDYWIKIGQGDDNRIVDHYNWNK